MVGGLALLAAGASTRPTSDFDAFTAEPFAVPRAAAAFAELSRSRGWQLEIVKVSDTFARLAVHGPETLMIDLALDSRAVTASIQTELGPTCSLDELVARKILALFGRALPRDFVDVYLLSHKVDIDDALAISREIDTGVADKFLAQAFRRLEFYADGDLPIDEAEIETMRRFFVAWRQRLDGGSAGG